MGIAQESEANDGSNLPYDLDREVDKRCDHESLARTQIDGFSIGRALAMHYLGPQGGNIQQHAVDHLTVVATDQAGGKHSGAALGGAAVAGVSVGHFSHIAVSHLKGLSNLKFLSLFQLGKL